MEWKNNLEKLVKESLKVSKATLPDSKVLQTAGCSERRFYALLNNDTKMTAWESIVFSDWLGTDPRDMVQSIPAEEESVNSKIPLNA